MIDERNFSQSTLSYDAVIAGGSLGGLVTAAILSNNGYKVALADALTHPGGRSSAVEYNGYWIDWGQRDALNGISDTAIVGDYHVEAARRAGITLKTIPSAYGEIMRVHRLPRGVCDEIPQATINRPNASADALEVYRVLVRSFTDLEGEEIDRVAGHVAAAMAKLASVSVTDAWALVPMRLGDWLERNVPDPMARVVLINQMEASHCSPGEGASVGRWILLIHRGGTLGDQLDDDEVGAMQTVVKPWVEAIKANGGDLYWGWKPIEISFDRVNSAQGRPRARGIVAVNECNFVRELRAPVVVTDYFGWDLPRLMDPALLPKDFLELAEATREYEGDVLGYFVGTNRMPRLRSTGELETFTGWQRIAYGAGPIKRYQGGFYWASAHHSHTAPPGKHLLHVSLSHHGVFPTWAEAKATLDQSVEYLRSFYLDLDECADWAEYQYVTPPQGNTWFLKPTYRHPVRVHTVDGLYCVASSAEGMGGWVADQVENALSAADMIIRDEASPGIRR